MFEILNDYGKNALHLKDCLSKEECDRLIEFGKLNAIQRRISYSEVAGGRYLESSAEVDIKNKDLFNLLEQRTLEAVKIYLNKNKLDLSLYNFNVTEKEKEKMSFTIKTWNIGGAIGNHRDSYKYSDGTTVEPEISVIVYLTDDFTGGDLVLLSADDHIDGELVNHNKDLDQTIRPIAGSMVVIDSKVIHKVTPVISGIRISADRAIHLFE
jgi:predicted 2-oxoglutarate/Fe(II)-dependent dioxygenase YbiX